MWIHPLIVQYQVLQVINKALILSLMGSGVWFLASQFGLLTAVTVIVVYLMVAIMSGLVEDGLKSLGITHEEMEDQ